MKATSLLVFGSLLLALPGLAAAPGDVIGEGHITAGTPVTSLITDDITGLQNFFVDLNGEAAIETSTVDNGGLGYDIDVYFYNAAGDYLSGCVGGSGDPVCAVPANAASAEIAALYGVDLDVTVLEA